MTIMRAPADVLLSLVVRRLAVAESVAAAKWSSGRSVEDGDREAVVLSAAAASARRAGIDATFVCRVMAAQIEASKIVQGGLIARWLDEPAAPTSQPELRGVRLTLEAIDEEFVTALAAPRPPVARRRVLQHCDGLRRRALECALAPLDRSYLRRSS
jgi:chorismate mutase